jgi:hypothetical protein
MLRPRLGIAPSVILESTVLTSLPDARSLTLSLIEDFQVIENHVALVNHHMRSCLTKARIRGS